MMLLNCNKNKLKREFWPTRCFHWSEFKKKNGNKSELLKMQHWLRTRKRESWKRLRVKKVIWNGWAVNTGKLINKNHMAKYQIGEIENRTTQCLHNRINTVSTLSSIKPIDLSESWPYSSCLTLSFFFLFLLVDPMLLLLLQSLLQIYVYKLKINTLHKHTHSHKIFNTVKHHPVSLRRTCFSRELHPWVLHIKRFSGRINLFVFNWFTIFAMAIIIHLAWW